MPEMKQKLIEADDKKNLAIVELVEKTFLFEGYIEHFEKIIPIPEDIENTPFPLVLAHNDA